MHINLIIIFLALSLQPLLGDLREELGSKLLVHFNGEELNEEARSFIQDHHVGGFVLFSWANGLKTKQQVATLCQELQAISTRPLIFAVDQEGGRITHLRGEFTTPPYPYHQSLLEVDHYAHQVGREMKEVGIHLNFAPVLDVVVDPHQVAIGLRSYGGDPQRVIDCGRAVLSGLRAEGVEGCVKHFPGLGSIRPDTHYTLPCLDKPLTVLEQEDLLPFMALLHETKYLMVGHVIVPVLDQEQPASLSSKIITDYLKGTLGYQGVVISDSLIMQGAIQHTGTIEAAVLQALKAGCDYVIIAGKVGDFEPKAADIGRILDYCVAHWPQ